MRPEVRPPARVVVGQVVGRDPEAVLDGGRTPVDRVDWPAVCQCAVPVEMWIDEIKQDSGLHIWLINSFSLVNFFRDISTACLS